MRFTWLLYCRIRSPNNIYVGNGIYGLGGNQNYLTPDGNFQVVNNAKVIMHSANVVGLLPGTNIFPGGEIDVYIQGYNCPDLLYRATENAGNTGNGHGDYVNSNPGVTLLAENIVKAKATNVIKVYPNPSHGNLNIEKETDDPLNVKISDLTGKVVFETIIYNAGPNNILTEELQSGIYLLEVDKERFKIVISK